MSSMLSIALMNSILISTIERMTNKYKHGGLLSIDPHKHNPETDMPVLFWGGDECIFKSNQDESKIGTRWAQKTGKNSDRNIKSENSIPGASFWTKKWPSWFQVGSQNGIKIVKKRVKKSMHFLMHA